MSEKKLTRSQWLKLQAAQESRNAIWAFTINEDLETTLREMARACEYRVEEFKGNEPEISKQYARDATTLKTAADKVLASKKRQLQS